MRVYKNTHVRRTQMLKAMATRRMKKAVTVSLKLLIDTDAKRVLFAEAGEDFVDFLRNLLALPVGTVIRILNNQLLLGSLGEDLFAGIENQSLLDFYPPYFGTAAKKPSSTCFYMVMDDLTVKPMSTSLSSFAPLNEFDGKEVGPIEQRVFEVRLAEVRDAIPLYSFFGHYPFYLYKHYVCHKR